MPAALRSDVRTLRLTRSQAYAFTIAVTALALWLRLAMEPSLGDAPGYAIFIVPVVLAALVGGVRTGLLATALSSLAVNYFVVTPAHSLRIDSAPDRWHSVLFVGAGIIVSMVVEALHRARRRAELAMTEHALSRRALESSEAIQLSARRASEASIRFQAHMLDNVGQAVIATDMDGRINYANQFVEELYGWAPEEILGKDILDVTVGKEGRDAAVQIMDSMQLGSKWNDDFIVRHRDGHEFPASVSTVPLRDEHGTVIGFVGVSKDITSQNRVAEQLRASVSEISRTNRALKMLSNCNKVLSRARNEVEFLDQICRIAVLDGGYMMTWVGYAEDNAVRSISPVASAGAEDGYLAQTSISWDPAVPEGQGPAGQIIRNGTAVICADIENDPAFKPWRALTAERGYRGFVGMPLRDGDRTFGLLALYSGVVYESTPEELVLLEEMAESIAFAILSLRAQSEQRRLEAAVLKVAAGVSASSGLEFFEQLAASMAQALGAHAAYVAQLLPGEPHKARTIAAFADDSFAANFDFLVAGTPCEMTPDIDSVVIKDRVAEQFPHLPRLTELGGKGYVCQRLDSSSGQPLGFVFVVFRQALERIDFIASTLKIFAARAASELERRETDVRLREQAAIMDIANEGIHVRDLAGRILYWNKGAERIYGWTSAEILGRNSQDFLDKDSDAFSALHKILLAQGTWQGEMVKITKDGRAITVEVRWTLVRDGLGNPKSILAINIDVTERKRLESQSRRAQRMESIGTLAGGIAHDLNNVLAPILMSVETLKGAVNSAADVALVDTLHASAQRGADLVKQLLLFARGVEGQRINLDPAQLIRQLLTVVRDTFPKSIAVRFSPPPNAWNIVGDPTQMHQVLLNLCVNARDAMPDGGTLTFGIRNVVLDATSDGITSECPPGRYLLMSVGDTGTGIPSENRDRVFEPFFTTKDFEKGTGLGLSTSLGIIKSHRGFIRFTSDAASGTTFHVYLPARPAFHAAEKIPSSSPAPFHGNGELVLLVDDDEAIRKVAQRLLEHSGYRVVVAVNGQEAVEVYERQRAEIAIVITDMSMPVMDGPATVRALRAMNPEVRIIVSSGLSSDGAVVTATGSSVRHFMSKPYTAQAMMQTLHEGLTAPFYN